jgi:hypothetical protein
VAQAGSRSQSLQTPLNRNKAGGGGMMAFIQPKNWSDFQHYRDRSPSWIKLHKRLLDDYDFQCLPIASKALAPMLWLIASEHEQGIIDADPKKLGFRLRMTSSQVTDALNPLIEGGFFSVLQDASGPLAEAERVASLEKRREEEENKKREEEIKRARARDFEEFWSLCPKKVGKPKAKQKFMALSVPAEMLVDRMRVYAASRRGEDQQFTLHPTTWLNQGRWEDEIGNSAKIIRPTAFNSPEEQEAQRKAMEAAYGKAAQ